MACFCTGACRVPGGSCPVVANLQNRPPYFDWERHVEPPSEPWTKPIGLEPLKVGRAVPAPLLTEEDIRRIIREELTRAAKDTTP